MGYAATTAAILPDGDLAANVASYGRHLRASNLSPKTVKAYLEALTLLAGFLTSRGMPTDVAAIRREHLESFIEDQLQRWKATTAANRFASIRPFFGWLVEEGEIRESPMARMRKPKVPELAPPVLADSQLQALFASCDGNGFDDRRDAALLRVFLSTGARLSEVANLRWTPDSPTTNDIDLDARLLRVMGKGRRERLTRLSPKTVRALDRYLRVRAKHSASSLPHLWLGLKGRLSDSGITQVVRRRGTQAGIPGLHPHLFRHQYAHEALAAGLQEGEVMALAGWRTREMLSRYAKSAERDRALAAADRVNVGDRI